MPQLLKREENSLINYLERLKFFPYRSCIPFIKIF